MYKYAVGEQVNGYVFGDPDNKRDKYRNGKVIGQFHNWLEQPCYVVQFSDGTYKLQEGRVEKIDETNTIN